MFLGWIQDYLFFNDFSLGFHFHRYLLTKTYFYIYNS